MPSHVEGAASLSETNPSKQRRITAAGVIGAVSVTILLAGQILLADAAAIWAITGLFHLVGAAVIVVALIFSLPALWACVKVAQLAWEAENDPDNT